MKQNCGDAAK